ncbi:glutamine amidotransferase-like class 1 domain-containing protein 1 isoform X2 [Dromiciops gliroides]|uniref:glutamine amidotransferase-like class 1 domain-containing protein 1 isoform X2 n=2 Tax=Dromiciops gliroides TaxID=33562 RepID=UPI001CC7BD63|nr:glutamine amidotransferase-like class 1 domain-containing protein 1 isoform X2 [Dromiciops gliroides]
MASERLPSRPACLIVASAAARVITHQPLMDHERQASLVSGRSRTSRKWRALGGFSRRPLISPVLNGVSAHSFLHCFTMGSAAFNLQVATPGGKAIDFVGVNESNMRWIQDFRMKAYASPAKLESIDGARYHALLIPSCPGALTDLANSGYLARILEHFSTEQKHLGSDSAEVNEVTGPGSPSPEWGPGALWRDEELGFCGAALEEAELQASEPICAVGHGVAALCCATKEDKSWVFQDYSLTGPSVYELIRQPGFGRLPIITEDFVKDAGASFSASQPDAVHVVLDRHLVTGQNDSSTVLAVQNLVFLCGSRK